MHTRSAAPAVVTAILVALVPVGLWAVAALFGAPDSRWLDSLDGLGVSIPIGLGIAAVGMVAHGLGLQRDFEEDVAHEYDRLLVAAPSSTVPHAGTNGSTPTAYASNAAVPGAAGALPAEPAPGPGPDVAGESMTVVDRGGGLMKSPQAKQLGDRVRRRAMYRGRTTVSRYVRNIFRF